MKISKFNNPRILILIIRVGSAVLFIPVVFPLRTLALPFKYNVTWGKKSCLTGIAAYVSSRIPIGRAAEQETQPPQTAPPVLADKRVKGL